MSKEEFAQMLNGREYSNEITDAEEMTAKAAGLVVVFGYSDDNVEIRGAIHDEISAYGGTEFMVSPQGLLESFESLCDDKDEAAMEKYFNQKPNAKRIEAVWGDSAPMIPWTFKTDIPHATFEIAEDGEMFCRGVVFELSALTPAPAPAETVTAG